MVENSRSGNDNGKHQTSSGVWMINNICAYFLQGKTPTTKKTCEIEVLHNFITFSSKQSGEKMEESRTHFKVVTVDVFVRDAMGQTTAEEDR